jgi:pimeloyl-ACP methyl ester carboxylesterase
MANQHRTGTTRSGDVDIFYRAFGDAGATPILIVHGLSFMSYDWIDIAGALATNREVVAMDMRGFGESSWSAEKKYSVADFSQDCIAVIDHLGWDKAVLMGHSMGGRNTTWCAAKNPDRVKALLLVDYSPQNAPTGSKRVATTVAGIPEVFGSIEEGMAYFDADPGDAKLRARYEAYLKPVEGGFMVKRDTVHRDRFRKVLAGEAPAGGPDMWDALARVRCPTLVVRGTRSDMFAPETAVRVRSANANITLVEVDAGHDVAGDNPDALLAEAGKFLETVE